jgi:drug/metabolite transporter (DMT)-like permease
VPYFRLLGAQLAVGAAAIFARFALSGTGPVAVSALRLALAELALVAGLLLFRRARRRLELRREAAFAAAGLALALHFATWIASLLFTSVAISTLLVATTPVWTEAYNSLARRRKPSPSYAIALALALAGIALIARQRSSPAPVSGHALLGAALALLGGLAIGAYLIVVRGAGREADGTPIATEHIVVRTYGWAAIALGLLALALRQPPPPAGNLKAWGGIAGMAFISQLLGHTAINASLRDFSPSIVAMSTLLEPVAASLLAAAIFGEAITVSTALGGALVIAAIALCLRDNVLVT